MSKIYVFSGLGVDKRVYNNVNFGNLNMEFLDWIPPLENESLENYAYRICEKIKDEAPILIGLSFGGMLAVEISKIIKVKKMILIASAKNKFELPGIYRFFGKIKLNKIIPNSLLKKQNLITNWFFGIQTNEEKRLLKDIFQDTDPQFLKWAMNEILNWNNESTPEKCFHIHGNKDRIIPGRNVKIDFVVEGGGHFMTVNKSKEIESILLSLIN